MLKLPLAGNDHITDNSLASIKKYIPNIKDFDINLSKIPAITDMGLA